MKVLVCLVVVCSAWLGVVQGRSVPYHSSEELYWGNTFNRRPYSSHSSEEHWWGWNSFGRGGAWDNTNRNLGTDWNSLFNTDVNTNWGTDWMNANNAGRDGEEPTVDNNTPVDQEGSAGQEVVTEANVPAESDVTTESNSIGNDVNNEDVTAGDVNVEVSTDDVVLPQTEIVFEGLHGERSLDGW